MSDPVFKLEPPWLSAGCELLSLLLLMAVLRSEESLVAAATPM